MTDAVSNLPTAEELVKGLRTDCLHYRGDRPCGPHTRSGARCTCPELIPVQRRGVIIKLGAAGDVLRTTPLLHAIDPVANGVHVLWITDHPDLLPADVCEPIKFEATTLARLMTSKWDFCWNLDKEVRACAIAAQISAAERAGYTLVNGVPYPVDKRAWHKFATGLDNPYSKANRLNYVQEIFDIVGLSYNGEEYWLRSPDESSLKTAEAILPGDGWIGLNTGAGSRWPTRIWPEIHWARLIKMLKDNGLRPVILGGPDEERTNERLASGTGSLWPGVQTLDVFYAMIHRCRCLVTSVTQAMHLAVGAKTPLVLFNNIFNPCEFELYGRGEIVGPRKPCDCYYDPICRTGRNCMEEIPPEQALAAVLRVLAK